MAVKPKKVSLTNDSTDITNAILNEMGSTNSSFPTLRADGTQESIQAVGNVILGNSEWANQFANTLMNRIVLTVIQSFAFSNPLKRFKRGLMEAGDAVEEIAFELAQPHAYNTTEDNEFPKQEKEEIYAAIHKINYQAYYKKTINRNQLLRAFTTVNGMRELADELINTMYQTAEVDEYIAMKYVVFRAYLDGFIKPITIPNPTTETQWKQVASTMKGVSNELTIEITGYNRFGLPTVTSRERQIVLITPIFEAGFNVNILAYAFNMEKADITGNIVYLTKFSESDMRRFITLTSTDGIQRVEPFTADELAAINAVPAFVLDERFFMVWDFVFEMTNFFNPEKMYWNYWLHCWKILSASPFVNAVAFTTAEYSITSLAIVPTTAAVNKNSRTTFSYSEEGSVVELPPLWTITGNQSLSTYITQYGVLFVDKNETAATITVTITQGEKTASATVTVNGNGSTG